MKRITLSKVVLFISISSLFHVVQPQLSQAQPCLVCGDAVLRIWSLMSRQGDRYLRITNRASGDSNNHKIIDCGASVRSDNFTSLLKVGDKTTFTETRIQLIFVNNNREYHLYAPSAGGRLLAMPASEGNQQTDHRNTFAPERLKYEHSLFTVFQSVKFRGYYLSCNGQGEAVLQQLVNKAYRNPNQLFLTIDPGNAIRGASFGNVVARKKREIPEEGDANQRKWKTYFYSKPRRIPTGYHKTWRYKILWRMTPKPKLYYTTPEPRKKTTEKPTTPRKYGSIETKFNLPLNITFVLCFWIKTTTRNAQLISVAEERPEEERKHMPWKRQTHFKGSQRKKNNKNIINVSLYNGNLKVELGYNKRIVRIIYRCDITDGKFHQICISLNHDYLMEIYRDSAVIYKEHVTGIARDFRNTRNLSTRPATFMLGQKAGMSGNPFDGSLFQVNLWDQYPSFRIRRIATNCACGGGTLVSWNSLLNSTMSDVSLEDNSQCPKLEGYNYTEIIQNRLI